MYNDNKGIQFNSINDFYILYLFWHVSLIILDFDLSLQYWIL